jgi:2-polyprenyl-3-methyl-5-hydroxy-6-metoxy-1,4-benzoquinol methylase
MPHTEIPNVTKRVELFYDGLAPTYDHEQFKTAVSMSKRKEYELFTARLPKLFKVTDRVLEIGAGTGIFTIPIARHCREVTAVDISRNMLDTLERKAAAEGITNIRTILCDVEKSDIEGTFSVICAFAVLEYMSDLSALLRKLDNHLQPGGVIYFITARRSFLRFFIQLGNAIRQRIWLKAYGHRQIMKMLRTAGCDRIEINHHLFKVLNCGGMLLEVVAHRAISEAPSQEHRQRMR